MDMSFLNTEQKDFLDFLLYFLLPSHERKKDNFIFHYFLLLQQWISVHDCLSIVLLRHLETWG